MRRQIKLACAAAALLLSALFLSPATPRSAAQQVLQPKYEDSTAGLKHAVEDMLVAAGNRDQTHLTAITKGFLLPDPRQWFSRVFGAPQGEIYTQAYEKLTPNMPEELARDLSDFALNKFTSVDITRFTESCDGRADETEYPVLAGRIQPEAVSTVTFHRADLSHSMRYFAFVDGAFRYLGNLKSPEVFATPVDPASQRYVAGLDEHPALLVKATPPNFPVLARSYVGNSEVVMHALVLIDGSVAEVHPIKGRCSVAEPVALAMRKWRYAPTVIDGHPSEVDMTIRVSLGRHW